MDWKVFFWLITVVFFNLINPKIALYFVLISLLGLLVTNADKITSTLNNIKY